MLITIIIKVASGLILMSGLGINEFVCQTGELKHEGGGGCVMLTLEER